MPQDIVDRHLRVRAGHDDNSIVSGVVGIDERDTRGAGAVLDQLGVNARAAQGLDQHRPEGVVADRAKHPDLAAKLSGGNRLVCSLSTRVGSETGTGNGLSGSGQARTARHQVGVQTAEHNDRFHSVSKNQ